MIDERGQIVSRPVEHEPCRQPVQQHEERERQRVQALPSSAYAARVELGIVEQARGQEREAGHEHGQPVQVAAEPGQRGDPIRPGQIVDPEKALARECAVRPEHVVGGQEDR